MGMPFGDVDRIAKLIPDELNITIEQALKDSPQLRELVEADDDVSLLVETASRLEGLARHRGSAFGQLPGGQPGQIDFENALAINLLKLDAAGDGPVYLEDEGRTVGSVHLPPTLWERMGQAPMVVVEPPVVRLPRTWAAGWAR